MPKLNKLPNQSRVRRFICYLAIFTLCLFVFAKVYGYYSENYSNRFNFTQSAPPYNEYISQNGQYLPYSGYKILQLVENPLSSSFASLTNHLNKQIQLKSYFRLVPAYMYHITLTDLKNQTLFNETQLSILKDEQEFLDRDVTTAVCYGDQTLILDKREIRLRIEIRNEEFGSSLKNHQKRWDEKFGQLITQHATSFYITLAYQYQSIPNLDIYNRLEDALKQWDFFPIDIFLDPIEICSYYNLISYKAVLPDEITY